VKGGAHFAIKQQVSAKFPVRYVWTGLQRNRTVVRAVRPKNTWVVQIRTKCNTRHIGLISVLG